MYTPPLVDGVRAHPCDLILAWAVRWGEVVTADQIPGGNMFVLMKRRVA